MIAPANVTLAPGASQGLTLSAQNTTGSKLANYTVSLSYSAGLTITNLTVSPAAKSAKLDTAKRLITVQWSNVLDGSTLTAAWKASATTLGVYNITKSAITYKIGTQTYTGNVNPATLTVAPDTTAPAAPTGLSATAGNLQGTLNWNANAESDLAGYNIYRATALGGPYTRINVGLIAKPATTYTDAGLVGATTYYYRVSAIDTAGNESAQSAEVSATPSDATPPLISNVRTAMLSSTRTSVSWTTDEAADSHVEYGPTTGYGQSSVLDTTRVTAHSINLVNLTTSSLYHYRVKSRDVAGNVAVSADLTFIAGQKPVVSLSGTLSANTTLTADNIYEVVGDVSVPGSVTLTLEAGTELRFMGYYGIDVSGALVARGTSQMPVRFTSGRATPAKRDWRGIWTQHPSSIVVVDNAVIEWAERGLSLLNVDGTGLVLNSIIQNNQWGVFTSYYTNLTLRTTTIISNNNFRGNDIGILVYGRSSPQITGNTIQGNNSGILLQGETGGTLVANPSPVIRGNSIFGNAYKNIWTFSYFDGANTVVDATGNWWGNTDVAQILPRIEDYTTSPILPIIDYGGFLDGPNGKPVPENHLYAVRANKTLAANTTYVAIGNIRVPPGITLAVQPGAVLKFPANSKFGVEGALSVAGTAVNPARFTSGRSYQEKGNWPGIEINASNMPSTINHAVITYADRGVTFFNAGGTLSNSDIEGNNTGVYVYGQSKPSIQGNIIKSNTHGVEVRGTSDTTTPGLNPNPLINNNSLYGNGACNYSPYLFVNASSVTLDAKNNWWGSTDAAVIAQKICDITKNPATSPTVAYIPFLGAPVRDETVTPPSLDTGVSVTRTNPYTVTGTSQSGSTIRLYVNGGWTATAMAGGDGRFSVNAILREGANSLYAESIYILVPSARSNTLNITLDTNVPPVDVSKVSVGPVTTGQVTVTGIAGSAELGASVRVSNPRNGADVSATTVADGSFSLALAARAGDNLVIYAIDIAGNQSPSRMLVVGGTPPPLSIGITTPTAGATLNDERVLVQGTFQGPANTGITVNGIAAQISDTTFYANNVPLVLGNNTLAATLTSPDGQTATQSITVTRVGESLMVLHATPESGLAPLTVTFSLTNRTGTGLQSIKMDYNGDGITDFETTNPVAPLTYTYLDPGVTEARATVTDTTGATHVTKTTIVVTATQSLDVGLRGTYASMLSQLRAGNINGALQYISGGMRTKYQGVFTALSSSLPTVVDQLGALESGSLGADMAEYVLVRSLNGQSTAYLVYFIRSEDGVWRIEGM